jgi:hypothetical protein
VKLATSRQILTHKLLHNSLAITTQKEYGLEHNRSGGLNRSTDLPQEKQSGAPVRTESLSRAGDSGGAGEVGGGVEAVEDATGCVGA